MTQLSLQFDFDVSETEAPLQDLPVGHFRDLGLDGAVGPLSYVIDLDERGMFYAHVEDAAGNCLFEVSNEDPETKWPLDSLWLVEDGFMRHSRDTRGLLKYLEQHNIAGPGCQLHLQH